MVIDRESLTARNVTECGHQFHPEHVVRRIEIRADGIWIVTKGEGIGGRQFLNYWAGIAGFRELDIQLARHLRNQ